MRMLESGPSSHDLKRWARIADVVGNSLFYAAVARAGGARVGPALLVGAAAGLTVVFLPRAIGVTGVPGRLVGMATSAAAMAIVKLPQREGIAA